MVGKDWQDQWMELLQSPTEKRKTSIPGLIAGLLALGAITYIILRAMNHL